MPSCIGVHMCVLSKLALKLEGERKFHVCQCTCPLLHNFVSYENADEADSDFVININNHS